MNTLLEDLLPRTQASAGAPLDLAEVLGPQAWHRLPARVRRRFGAHVEAICYQGTMDLYCSPLGRVMAWLAWPLRGPLVPHCAKQLPVEVSVTPQDDGGIRWTRRLGRQEVSSVKSHHPNGGVLERTRGGLAMALDVFEERQALVFQSRRYLCCIGPLRLPLPGWLTPGRCRVEHRDLGAGRFRFTLTMTHPLWGLTFQQTGDFVDPIQEN